MSECLEGVRPEDLHPIYQEIAAIVGLENAIAIGRHFDGQYIYLPKVQAVIEARSKHEMIVREFDGRNYRDLARKYEFTEGWVRQIIARHRRQRGS